VDHHREPAQRGPPLDVCDQIRRNLHSFAGRPEDEVPRVEDELLAVGDVALPDVVVHLPGVVRVDTRNVGAPELQKLRPQPEVDAGGLHLSVDVRQRFDHQLTVGESGENVRVREDHRSEPVGAGT
jgi:hypothetical protein